MSEQITSNLPDTLGQCVWGTRVLIESLESTGPYTRGYRADWGTVLRTLEDGRVEVQMDYGPLWVLQPTRILDVDRYVLP